MKKSIPYFILIGLTFLVYGNTLLNSFHFDDVSSILEKPWIRGLDKIPQFIFSFRERPLVILSFNINYAISEFRVWSYHVFNVLAHAGVTLLVYEWVRLMGAAIALVRPGGISLYSRVPFIAALIFALHPLNTQSVTYISSRSSILATFFYLAALVLFFRGFLRRRLPERGRETATGETTRSLLDTGWPHFAGAGVALILGGLSKAIIVTLPAMGFLYHFYFISGVSFRRWLAANFKWILPVGVILSAGLLIKIFFGGGLAGVSAEQYSASTYFLTQTFVIPLEYFWKMFFPINLNIDVDFPIASDWTRLSSYGGLGILLVYAMLCLRVRNPWIGFGMAWSLITLLPTSSFVPLLDVATEHRTYLPLVGFSVFLAATLCHLGGLPRGGNLLRCRSRHAALAGTLLVILLFSAGVVKRNGVWKDEMTLWSDTQKKSPKLVRPYNNLGEAYDKLQRYDEAISEFQKALSLNPNYVFALNNLGNVYGKLDNYDKAVEYFQKALTVKPDYAPSHYNLAKALHITGNGVEAVEYYRRAVEVNPYFEQAIFNLAHLESELGMFKRSIENYLQFIKMQPRHYKAYFGLGAAYFMNRQYEQAIAAYQKAIRLNPAYISPQVNLATIYMQTGKMDQAIAIYEKLLAINPGIAGVHKNLGLIYSRNKNSLDKAIYHFKQSLLLDEKQPQAPVIQATIAQLEKAKRESETGTR